MCTIGSDIQGDSSDRISWVEVSEADTAEEIQGLIKGLLGEEISPSILCVPKDLDGEFLPIEVGITVDQLIEIVQLPADKVLGRLQEIQMGE